MLSGAFNDARTKEKKPKWISDPIWEALLAKWNDPDFKRLQEQNKKNRAANPGASLHCGGSISMTEHTLRYEKQTGKKPQFSEMFLNLHKKKKKSDVGEWVDPYAAEKYETFSKEKERLSTASTEEGSCEDSAGSVPSDMELWRQVVGEKKGRVYGMGSQAQTMWSAVHQGGGSSSSGEIVEMKKMMNSLQESMNYLMQQFAVRQPPMPYPPWSSPPMPYPPSQMPHPPFQMPSPPSQMPPPSFQMPPPAQMPPPVQMPPPSFQMPPPAQMPPASQMQPPPSQMQPPPPQMPPPHYYPWMQPPLDQYPSSSYPWMQPSYPGVWPHYPAATSEIRQQGQIPTNANVNAAGEDEGVGQEEDEEDLGFFD